MSHIGGARNFAVRLGMEEPKPPDYRMLRSILIFVAGIALGWLRWGWTP